MKTLLTLILFLIYQAGIGQDYMLIKNYDTIWRDSLYNMKWTLGKKCIYGAGHYEANDFKYDTVFWTKLFVFYKEKWIKIPEKNVLNLF